MEKEELLPKPELDLPIPEKEIPANTGRSKFPIPKYILLGIVFIVLLLIAGAAVLGGKYYLDQQKLKSISDFESCAAAGNPIQESYPATCKTPDGRSFTQELSDEEKEKLDSQSSTADWKTFTNSDFGYSFKHPSNLIIEELEDQYNLITANKTKSIKISPNSGEYSLNIFVEKNPKNLSTVDLLTNYKSTIEKPTNPNDPSGKFVIDKINNSLSEYKNGEIEGLHALFGFDYDYDIVIATKNNNIYIFDYYGDQGGKITENNEKMVNQILSTFKFTDSDSSTDTSDWKTFNGPAKFVTSNSPYSFKYPPTWSLKEDSVGTSDRMSASVYSSRDEQKYIGSLGIDTMVVPEGQNIEVFIDDHTKDGVYPNFSLNSYDRDPSAKTINGDVMIDRNAGGAGPNESAIVLKGKIAVLLTCASCSDKLMNQILSTFKFNQ